MRLDRFLGHNIGKGRSNIQNLLASGKVIVDGHPQTNSHHSITQFTHVAIENRILQDETPLYIMLNKPAGYLSATTDPTHPTVLELLPEDLRPKLHIAGRLDRASTGLLVLTNDGSWSRKLTEPKEGIAKVYIVETAQEISQDAIQAFQNGFYFAYEDITTQPANLEILAPKKARVSIHEGRYHQIKRMFHAVENKVTSLHRTQIGKITLDPDLLPGSHRQLSPLEL